ncbi:MAG: IS3 family transposase [Anaerolineae bacterium]|nr:IS3 family transposase [Anaerolineae bacterium]MBT6814239.1 IS3 family transposase [Anaerolineae bacterium]
MSETCGGFSVTKKRKKYSGQFKFKIALEAVKGQVTINEIASSNNIHPNQVSTWKKQLLVEGPTVFGQQTAKKLQEQTAREAELFEQIGRLKMELEWLKKKLPHSSETKRMLIESDHPTLSIRRQCELIGLNRATFYWQPAGETLLNLKLMHLIDREYTRAPFYGYRKMTFRLNNVHGYQVNHKRVFRLMRKMGLQAVFPRPRTSIPNLQHKKYPYLLRGLAITHSNQVWSTDITYIPMPHGFMYLVAIIDWYSRFVIAWQLSNTLDGSFCLETLLTALRQGQPEIFNSDQGVQFTAHAFTGALAEAGIRISMDGRGRAFDNIFVERLWRTVKYENIYIQEYATVPALLDGLEDYFKLYNYERPHQSLNYRVPADVHFS